MLPHQLKKAVAEAEAHAAAAAGQQSGGKGTGGSTHEDGGQGISAGEADRLRQLQRDRAQLQLRKLQVNILNSLGRWRPRVRLLDFLVGVCDDLGAVLLV